MEKAYMGVSWLQAKLLRNTWCHYKTVNGKICVEFESAYANYIVLVAK